MALIPGSVPANVDGLEFLCNHFNIPPALCTCELFNITSTSGSAFLCDKNVKIEYESYEVKQHQAINSVYAAIVILASVVGIFGNLAVILVTPKKNGRRKLSRHQQLIIVLAIFDLLFSIANAIKVTAFLWTPYWLYGEVMCYMFSGMIPIGAWIAIGIILIIAIERFMGIVHPFKAGLGKRMMYFLLLLNVIGALLIVIPLLLNITLTKRKTTNDDQEVNYECNEIWSDEAAKIAYSWTLMTIYFVFPVTAILLLYWRIFKVLYNSLSAQIQISSAHEKMNAKRLSDNRKSMTILSFVLVAFIVFTFPNKLRHVITDTSGNENLVSWTVFLLIEMMYSFHVAVNPIIYSLIDTKFKRELVITVRKLFCCYKADINRRDNSIANGISNDLTSA